MAFNNIPSNLGNLVGPFLPAGQRPVGQETAENRNSTLKPIEQAAKTAQTQVQLNDHEPEGQGQQQGQDEQAPDREEPAPGTADVDDEVELYSTQKRKRAAPRGCLFNKLV